MNELDLDELDKAVSAMMDQTNAAAEPPKDDKPAATPASMPSLAADDKATEEKPGVREKTSAPEREPAKPADRHEKIGVRRTSAQPQVQPRQRLRGSAMDIVNSAPAVSNEPKPVSPRVASTIAPTAPKPPETQTTEAATDETPVDVMSHDQSEETQQPALTANFQKKTIAPLQSSPAPEPAPAETPTPQEDSTATTPFVAAKVEKRPLGAYSAQAMAEVVQPASEPEQPETSDKSTAMPAETPTTVNATAPDVKEFSPEVMAAETADAARFAGGNASFESFEKPETPKGAKPQDDHAKDSKKPDEKVTNIYDHKEYHAMPQHVIGKKKGSSLVVFLVIILILLIAAAGALAYLYFTGNMDLINIF